jgi:nitroreductase
VDPADCTPLKNNLPDPEKMKNLIKGRRSVRFYQEKSLPQETLQELMDVVWHAPTGVNEQSVLLTLIDTREAMIALRDEVYARLEEYFAQQGEAEQNPAYLFACVKQWKERRNDVIFRGAPHMLITSAPNTASCGEADCHILLSYFELLAQSMGFGTLWNGMAKTTLNVLLPDLKQKLGIPEDHLFGYAMIFGNPDIRYARTVERGPAKLNRVSKL